MATKKPTGPTVIGKDLITEGTNQGTKTTPDSASPQVTATAVKDKKSAKKAPAKKRTPRKKAVVPEPVESWDQRKDESGTAYEAFLTYRNLGLTRSIAKARAVLVEKRGESGVKTPMSAMSTMEGWSSSHSWLLRVKAYDQHLDREWVLETKERRRKAARRNADMAATAMELVARRLTGLTALYARHDEAEPGDENEVQLDILDLRRLVDSLGKLERLALGESTENVQVTGKDGKAVELDVSFVTDEERMDRMLQIKQEIEDRIVKEGGEDL